MKAIVLHGIKEPLAVEQVPKPVLTAKEVLVHVRAAAFNRRDWWIQQGRYAGLKFPIIPGSDGSGVVADVGGGVDGRWLGKEVVINPSIGWGGHQAFQHADSSILGLPRDGTFAEYVAVPAENLYEKPSHLTFEEAAALPLAGLTAFRALFSRAGLKRGEKVVVVGIGGGVASFILQFAVHAGAEVYVTSGSTSKIEQAMVLGARGGVRYTDEDWAEQLHGLTGGVDVIVDSALGDAFAHHVDLLNPGGRIVFFGGTAGDIPALNARRIFWKQLSILGSTMGSPSDFAGMLDFVSRNGIVPVVDSVYPLDDAEVVLRKMDHSSQFGKLVCRVSG